MKQFIVACLLVAAVAGAPSNSYGGQQQMGSSYGGSSYGSPAQATSYSGPDQTYNSQPVEYRTPQVSFIPPQITYSQPAVTYSQPQTISIPQQQQTYSAPPAYTPSNNYGSAIQMGYQGQSNSYGSSNSYSAPAKSGY